MYDKARESIELIYGNVNTQIETFEQKFQDEKLRAAAKSAGIDVDATIQKMKAAAESGRKNDIANLQADMEKTYKLLEQAYAQNVEESIAEYVKSHSKTGTSILGVSTATTPKAVLESEAQAIVDEKYAEIRALMSQMNGLAGYATGGTPRKAQLFYAREDGIPELVGRMGTQTAVANNYQIEQGISDAVYRAMVSANGGSGGNNQPLIIQVIDDTGNIKVEQYISAAERKNLRDGKVTIPLGV